MNNSDGSKTIINDWVANCTNGKIENLFSKMSPNTACVLVSCVYFKGGWLNKFESYNTRDAQFYCSKTKTSIVKMMEKKVYLSYISVDEKGFKCVEIPYKEPYFSMLIILPDVTFGLQNVIQILDINC